MRKRTVKSKPIALFIVIACVLAALSGAACGKPEPTETLTIGVVSEAFRDELVITREYDAETLIEKEDGVTYSLKNVFYMNADFERVDIPFDGMKFTQNEPYNVTVVIHGESETEYGDVTVELKISYLTNAVERALVSSWNDEGVVKTYTASEKYRTGGAATAIKVRYNGDYNPINDGVNYGSFIDGKESFTYTRSDNAVIAFDVYNANDFDLVFGLQHTADKQNYGINMNVSVPAGRWTKVCWSLHALGYDADAMLERGGFGLKVRVPDDAISAPYDYTFYICNPDVADYTAEKFPGLETRTPEEIAQEYYESLEGDEIDRKLVGFAPATANYAVTTDTTVKKEGESSIKATFTRDDLLAFTTYYRGTMMYDKQGVLSSVYKPADIDWNHAFFGVWFKHSAESKGKNISLKLCFANTQDGSTYRGDEYFEYGNYANNKNVADTDEWQYLEWDLSAFGIATSGVTDYKFCLCAEVIIDNGESASFYLDDVKVFSKSAKDYLTTTHTPNYAAEIDTETVHEGSDYSIKYTFTKGKVGYTTPLRGTFLSDVSGNLFDYKEVNKVESWSDKIYIGFWLKDTTASGFNMAVRFANTQDGTTYKGWKAEFEMGSYQMAPNIDATSEWQYFEYSLSDVIDGVYDGLYTENVTGWKLVLATEIGGDGGTFYVSGLKVFSKSAKEIMTSSHTPNYAAEIDTETVHEGSDYSVKYTFTPDKVGYPTGRLARGTFLSDVSGNLFDYKEVNKVTDWSQKVYVGFWFKNTSGNTLDLGLRFANTQDGTTYKGWKFTFEMESYNMRFWCDGAITDWTYLEMCVSDEVMSNDGSEVVHDPIYTENVTGWKLALATEIGGNGGTFYVSGLSVYNK